MSTYGADKSSLGSSSPPPTSPVIPITRKFRRSVSDRIKDDHHLLTAGEKGNLLMDEDRSRRKFVPSYSQPVPTVQFRENNHRGKLIENSPFAFLGVFFIFVGALKLASFLSLRIDFDVALLVGFALFCVGLHMPRPAQDGIDTVADDSKLLVSSVKIESWGSQDSATGTICRTLDKDIPPIFSEAEDSGILIKSPLPLFSKSAKFGSHFNCWSVPDYDQFKVRGPNYLTDKIKISSGEYLFPARGMDLFLTDTCPENVGTNSGILGGKLREKPTFIVNFRLPWGVVIFYFEIPERLIPFIRKRYELDYEERLPALSKMRPSERCLAEFLMADQDEKNKTLKIIPFVAEGPWIVKSVVGSKPAIIGNKLPVHYIYEKSEFSGSSKEKAMYLEADLDIVSSPAARAILSVARNHTNILTLDLGFVVQGNHQDELPEQMLSAIRMHGIDVVGASPLPRMKNHYMLKSADEEDSFAGD